MASESRRESPAQLTICGHTKHYSIKQTVRGDKQSQTSSTSRFQGTWAGREVTAQDHKLLPGPWRQNPPPP